MSTSDY